MIIRVAVLQILLAGASLAQQNLASQPATVGERSVVSLFAGSQVYKSKVSNYGQYVFAGRPTTITTNGAGIELKTVKRVEGKIFQYVALPPTGRGALEVFRSFQQALSQAGFKTLFTCGNRDCGQNFFGVLYQSKGLNNQPFYQGLISQYLRDNYLGDMRYLTAQLQRGSGDIFVELTAAEAVGHPTMRFFGTSNSQPFYILTVIEPQGLDPGAVVIDAKAMADTIHAEGKVALHSLYFDTNSAALKPESEFTLVEIQKLFQANASLRLRVVGHTDSVGEFAANTDLSKNRAAAVASALVNQYKIDPSRLASYGVGSLSPVTSNGSEDGRAKNRRVELVEF